MAWSHFTSPALSVDHKHSAHRFLANVEESDGDDDDDEEEGDMEEDLDEDEAAMVRQVKEAGYSKYNDDRDRCQYLFTGSRNVM